MKVFFVWNAWSILECISSIKDYKDYYIVIDTDYNKFTLDNISNLVEKAITKGIFKGKLDYSEIRDTHIDSLVIMSYINSYYEFILNNLNYDKLIFLEEGFSDYSKEGFYIPDCVTIYVNNTADLKFKECYEKVKGIKYSQETLDIFFDLLGCNLGKDNNSIDLIFFTSPINTDHGVDTYEQTVIDYITKNYRGKNILLKNHPRDNLEYYSDTYNIIKVDKNIPGQFIDMYYSDVDKLYSNPSTVILTSKCTDRTTIMKFKCLENNTDYARFFDYDKIQECKIVEV